MGYVTSVLGLQARSRRNARNASRAISLQRSQAASGAAAVAAAAAPPRPHGGATSPEPNGRSWSLGEEGGVT